MGPADGYQLAVSAVSSEQGRTLSLLSELEISGSVSVRGTISGALALPRFDGQLDAGPVNVRGVPFRSASGDVSFKDKMLSIVSAISGREVRATISTVQ